MEFFLSILLIGSIFFCLKMAARFIDSQTIKKNVSEQESEVKKAVSSGAIWVSNLG